MSVTLRDEYDHYQECNELLFKFVSGEQIILPYYIPDFLVHSSLCLLLSDYNEFADSLVSRSISVKEKEFSKESYLLKMKEKLCVKYILYCLENKRDLPLDLRPFFSSGSISSDQLNKQIGIEDGESTAISNSAPNIHSWFEAFEQLKFDIKRVNPLLDSTILALRRFLGLRTSKPDQSESKEFGEDAQVATDESDDDEEEVIETLRDISIGSNAGRDDFKSEVQVLRFYPADKRRRHIRILVNVDLSQFPTDWGVSGIKDEIFFQHFAFIKISMFPKRRFPMKPLHNNSNRNVFTSKFQLFVFDYPLLLPGIAPAAISPSFRSNSKIIWFTYKIRFVKKMPHSFSSSVSAPISRSLPPSLRPTSASLIRVKPPQKFYVDQRASICEVSPWTVLTADFLDLLEHMIVHVKGRILGVSSAVVMIQDLLRQYKQQEEKQDNNTDEKQSPTLLLRCFEKMESEGGKLLQNSNQTSKFLISLLCIALRCCWLEEIGGELDVHIEKMIQDLSVLVSTLVLKSSPDFNAVKFLIDEQLNGYELLALQKMHSVVLQFLLRYCIYTQPSAKMFPISFFFNEINRLKNSSNKLKNSSNTPSLFPPSEVAVPANPFDPYSHLKKMESNSALPSELFRESVKILFPTSKTRHSYFSNERGKEYGVMWMYIHHQNQAGDGTILLLDLFTDLCSATTDQISELIRQIYDLPEPVHTFVWKNSYWIKKEKLIMKLEANSRSAIHPQYCNEMKSILSGFNSDSLNGSGPSGRWLIRLGEKCAELLENSLPDANTFRLVFENLNSLVDSYSNWLSPIVRSLLSHNTCKIITDMNELKRWFDMVDKVLFKPSNSQIENDQKLIRHWLEDCCNTLSEQGAMQTAYTVIPDAASFPFPASHTSSMSPSNQSDLGRAPSILSFFYLLAPRCRNRSDAFQRSVIDIAKAIIMNGWSQVALWILTSHSLIVDVDETVVDSLIDQLRILKWEEEKDRDEIRTALLHGVHHASRTLKNQPEKLSCFLKHLLGILYKVCNDPIELAIREWNQMSDPSNTTPLLEQDRRSNEKDQRSLSWMLRTLDRLHLIGLLADIRYAWQRSVRDSNGLQLLNGECEKILERANVISQLERSRTIEDCILRGLHILFTASSVYENREVGVSSIIRLSQHIREQSAESVERFHTEVTTAAVEFLRYQELREFFLPSLPLQSYSINLWKSILKEESKELESLIHFINFLATQYNESNLSQCQSYEKFWRLIKDVKDEAKSASTDINRLSKSILFQHHWKTHTKVSLDKQQRNPATLSPTVWLFTSLPQQIDDAWQVWATQVEQNEIQAATLLNWYELIELEAEQGKKKKNQNQSDFSLLWPRLANELREYLDIPAGAIQSLESSTKELIKYRRLKSLANAVLNTAVKIFVKVKEQGDYQELREFAILIETNANQHLNDYLEAVMNKGQSISYLKNELKLESDSSESESSTSVCPSSLLPSTAESLPFSSSTQSVQEDRYRYDSMERSLNLESWANIAETSIISFLIKNRALLFDYSETYARMVNLRYGAHEEFQLKTLNSVLNFMNPVLLLMREALKSNSPSALSIEELFSVISHSSKNYADPPKAKNIEIMDKSIFDYERMISETVGDEKPADEKELISIFANGIVSLNIEAFENEEYNSADNGNLYSSLGYSDQEILTSPLLKNCICIQFAPKADPSPDLDYNTLCKMRTSFVLNHVEEEEKVGIAESKEVEIPRNAHADLFIQYLENVERLLLVEISLVRAGAATGSRQLKYRLSDAQEMSSILERTSLLLDKSKDWHKRLHEIRTGCPILCYFTGKQLRILIEAFSHYPKHQDHLPQLFQFINRNITTKHIEDWQDKWRMKQNTSRLPHAEAVGIYIQEG